MNEKISRVDARILKWQELSRNRNKASIEEVNSWKEDSIRREEDKRRSDEINSYLHKIPLRFRNKSFDDFLVENTSQDRIKKLMIRYVDTFKERCIHGTSVIFKGLPGTGKTLLSQIICQTLLKAGFRVKYESSLEFIKKLLEIKFKSQAAFESHLDCLKSNHLLIIDEVTESINKDGKPTELEKQLLFKIINERYENKLCTLVITNRDSEELIYRLGEPIVDRLSEKGISLAFNWESYRKK